MLNVTLNAIMLLVNCVACWIIFEKFNEAGWKSLIPFYGSFTETEKYGIEKKYYIMHIVAIICSIVIFMLSNLNYVLWDDHYILTTMIVLCIIIIICEVSWLIKYCTSKALHFNKPKSFAWGLALLSVVFNSIIAFDSDCNFNPEI